jgi:hypothetical protein
MKISWKLRVADFKLREESDSRDNVHGIRWLHGEGTREGTIFINSFLFLAMLRWGWGGGEYSKEMAVERDSSVSFFCPLDHVIERGFRI